MLRISKAHVNFLIAYIAEKHLTIFTINTGSLIAPVALYGFLILELLKYLKEDFVLYGQFFIDRFSAKTVLTFFVVAFTLVAYK